MISWSLTIASASVFVKKSKFCNARSISLLMSDSGLMTDFDSGCSLQPEPSESLWTTIPAMLPLTFRTVRTALLCSIHDGTASLFVLASGFAKKIWSSWSLVPLQQCLGIARAQDRWNTWPDQKSWQVWCSRVSNKFYQVVWCRIAVIGRSEGSGSWPRSGDKFSTVAHVPL